MWSLIMKPLICASIGENAKQPERRNSLSFTPVPKIKLYFAMRMGSEWS